MDWVNSGSVGEISLLSSRLLRLLALIFIALLPVQLETTKALGFRVAPGDAMLALMAILLVGAKGPIALLRDLRKKPAVIGATALALWFCLTLPVTAHALGGITSYVLVNKIIGLGCLILILATYSTLIDSRGQVTWAMRWYMRFGSVWNALGLLAWVVHAVGRIHTPFVFGPGRLSGLLIDPNAYGGFLVSLFLLQLGTLNSAWRLWAKRAGVWHSLLLLTGIFLTISRSAAVALCAGGLLLWFEYQGRGKRVVRLLLLMALVTAILIWVQPLWQLWSSSAEAPEVTEESVEAMARIQNLAWRFSAMVSALKAFARSPLWGIGLGVFSHLEGSRKSIIHNTFLWLLTETGIMGFLIFGFVMVAIWLAYRKTKVLGDGEIASLGAAVVAWLGLMLGIEALYQRHFWFLCALMVSLGASHGTMKQQPTNKVFEPKK
jgi:hypothetical protein